MIIEIKSDIGGPEVERWPPGSLAARIRARMSCLSQNFPQLVTLVSNLPVKWADSGFTRPNMGP